MVNGFFTYEKVFKKGLYMSDNSQGTGSVHSHIPPVLVEAAPKQMIGGPID
jgi:hypothetical protein